MGKTGDQSMEGGSEGPHTYNKQYTPESSSRREQNDRCEEKEEVDIHDVDRQRNGEETQASGSGGMVGETATTHTGIGNLG